MFSCFDVTKLHESIRFHVFSPFNAHFSPLNDVHVMVNGPLGVYLQLNTYTQFLSDVITKGIKLESTWIG